MLHGFITGGTFVFTFWTLKYIPKYKNLKLETL